MQLLKVTHANRNSPLYIVAQQVFSYYFSEKDACTHVLSVGGAIVPVKQSLEEVTNLLVKAKQSQETQISGIEEKTKEKTV